MIWLKLWLLCIEDDARKLMLEKCGSLVNGLDSGYWTGYCFSDVLRAWFCFLMCMFCADMFWSNSIQDAESCITCWLIFRQIILYLSTPSIGSKWCQWRGVITACLCHIHNQGDGPTPCEWHSFVLHLFWFGWKWH
jgi:hypothetical protein